MAGEINTHKYEDEIVELINERRRHFNDENPYEYDEINRELARKKSALQDYYNYNSIVKGMEYLPETEYGTAIYTRYETLPIEYRERITRYVHPRSLKWVYCIGYFKMAKNLKDAFNYLKKEEGF